MKLLPITFLFIYTLALGIYAKEEVSSKSFEKTIKPFIKNYCLECHNNKKTKGDLNFHDIEFSKITSSKSFDTWNSILDQISHSDMPPEEEKQQPSSTTRKHTEKLIQN